MHSGRIGRLMERFGLQPQSQSIHCSSPSPCPLARGVHHRPSVEEIVEENDSGGGGGDCPQPTARRLCDQFKQTGACMYGHKCKFQHGEEDVRPELTEVQAHRKAARLARSQVDRSSLQQRFDRAADLSAEESSALMADLHAAGEYAAFVFLWDILKAQGGTMTPELKQQLYDAHGKGAQDTLTVPDDRRRMSSKRRIHKIVMGPIRSSKLKRRSEAAVEYVATAAEWYNQSTKAKTFSLASRNGRKKLAKLMCHAGLHCKGWESWAGLEGITANAALGVITKLKQKKLV